MLQEGLKVTEGVATQLETLTMTAKIKRDGSRMDCGLNLHGFGTDSSTGTSVQHVIKSKEVERGWSRSW